MAEQPKPRPVPVTITQADLKRALEAWRRDAPPKLRGLLDAKAK